MYEFTAISEKKIISLPFAHRILGLMTLLMYTYGAFRSH